MTPYQYGVKAYESGKPCAPALDREFLQKHITGLKVGEGLPVLKEWCKGWHESNVASEVVNVWD